MNSFSLYVSNLLSFPDAFDFSQGLVFYHIKAAGCVCFSGARGGGEGRTAGVPSQLGMPGKAAGGRGGMLRPLLLAWLWEEGEPSPGRGLCSNPGLAKSAEFSPPLTDTAALGWLRTAATQRKQREESSTFSRSSGVILHPPPPPFHRWP